MDGHNLTNEQILAFSTALFQAERSQATVEKYLRSVREFFRYLDGRPVTKDTVMAWKKYLQREENYSPSTVNASLAALNYLFNFLGWSDCRTHYLKIQRRLFRETGRELDILTDYLRQGPQGTYCLDSTDYLLPVTAGERLAVVRRTSRGALAKKDGVTGWYLGPLGEG